MPLFFGWSFMSVDLLHQQALQAINHGDFLAAHPLCVQIVQKQPDHADAYFLLGIINSEVGQFAKAIKLMEKAILLHPQAEYYAYLAKCLSLKGDMQGAIEALQNISLEQLNNPAVLDTIGVAWSRIGFHEKAISYFTKALKGEQGNPQYFYNYAVSCKFAGQFSQAEEAFEQAINLKPDFYAAHFALSDLSREDPDNKRLTRLSELAKQEQDSDAQLHLNHALAKEYELRKDYSAAFKGLSKAKKNKLDKIDYHFEQDQALFDCVAKLSQISNESKVGCQSSRPIFVLGMPRSGTTLVERILSSHSKVTSGGELQDFGIALKELARTPSANVLDLATLQAGQHVDPSELGQRYIERTQIIGSDTEHFVDKLPFNFFYLPFIRRALPNAKIVCLLRDPMDTCVGNFRQLFSINSPHYAYSFDLLTIGRFYAQFYQLAHQWQAKQDSQFMLLNYEELVSQPALKVRELIEFCGLDWQEQCMHAERNQAPVSTASKVQVREPINTGSIGRWKRYAPHTDGLADLLEQFNIPFAK